MSYSLTSWGCNRLDPRSARRVPIRSVLSPLSPGNFATKPVVPSARSTIGSPSFGQAPVHVATSVPRRSVYRHARVVLSALFGDDFRPAERAECIRALSRVEPRVDPHLEPFERKRAAVDYDAMEVRHVVTRMHRVGRVARGKRVTGLVNVRVTVEHDHWLAECRGVRRDVLNERFIGSLV